MASLYQISTEPVLRVLKNLQGILRIGKEHCTTNGLDESELTTARLAPDMQPLSFQIIVLTCMARATSFGPDWKYLAIPEDPDFRKALDFAAMDERMQKTIDALEALPPLSEKQQQEALTQSYEIHAAGKGVPNATFTFSSAINLLNQYLMPNIYFHMTTAYDILRHKGVQLGKRDFLSAGGAGFS